MGRLQIITIVRRLYHAITDLHWSVLALVLLAHMAASWLLLAWAGEAEFSGLPTFIYWYATTASTVGYGDITPDGDAGRLITAFFVFPGAIAAFTSILAKSFAAVSARWRRARVGLGDYREMNNATVLIGYDAERTPRMIDELVADAEPGQQLILLTRTELTNDDARIRYVRARSLTAAAELERAGVANAGRVIVFTSNDNDTLAVGLAVTALNRTGHIVCYFQDDDNALLLAAHCPRVETVLAPSVELVVKAVKDPGASRLLADLVSHTDKGATLFSMRWTGTAPASFREVASRLIDMGAVLLSSREADEANAGFRFDTNGSIAPGDMLFYVAERRLAPSALGA